MSMKPGLIPINPKDAKSAIRAYKMLESDVVRINQDLRTKRVCDVEGARFSIQRKQRQLTELKNWMRSYHIDMSQFDKLEARRQEQSARKQHAIFETQRKNGTPAKGSPEQKAAVHNEIIESVSTPILPPATTTYVPPQLPVQKVEYSGWEFTSTTPMKLLRMIEESTEVEDIQYIKPSLPPGKPTLLVTGGMNYGRHMAIIQEMLERIYNSRNTYEERAVVYQHLEIVYGVNQTPVGQRVATPIQAPPPAPYTPPLPPKGTKPQITPDPIGMDSNWIELALTKADWLRYNRSDPVWLQDVISHQRLRVRKGEYRNIVEAKAATEKQIAQMMQLLAQKEQSRREALEEAQRRGQQALLEEQARQAAKQIDFERRMKQADMERIKLEEANAKHAAALREQEMERNKLRAHELKLAADNKKRRLREVAEESAQKAREQANAIRKRDDEFKQMEQVRQRQEEGMRRNSNDLDAARRAAEPIFQEINKIETQILPGLDMEMQHSKMYNPEVMQDLAGDRERHLNHLKTLKSQVAPLIAAVKAENERRYTASNVSADNTAGLRMWHKNLFTNKSKRDSSKLSRYLSSNYNIASLPTHAQEGIRNILSSYEYGKYGSEAEAQGALDSIILENQLQSGQASKNAAALSGTPRHMRHGKSALLPNNYQRLRQIQSGEEQEKAVLAATKQVAEDKSQLAGMFPKLRDSVTRMVGH